jgi:hypothetical protein
VGPRADLDAVEKRKIFPLAVNRTPAVQPVARHYTIQALGSSTLNIFLVFHFLKIIF